MTARHALLLLICTDMCYILSYLIIFHHISSYLILLLDCIKWINLVLKIMWKRSGGLYAT